MPEAFERCRREGGRIRTMTLSKGRYMHVCWDKNNKSHAGEVKTKNNKSHAGEVKTKKKTKSRRLIKIW